MIGKLSINIDKSVTIETENEIIKYKFASFGQRLKARLIDILIIIIPNALIPVISAWLYWGLQQSGKKQSTIGQELQGIVILDLDGRKISFKQASIRFFVDFLNILTFFIGYLLIFFNNKNQCLHDFISGCIVVVEIDRHNKIQNKKTTPLKNKLSNGIINLAASLPLLFLGPMIINSAFKNENHPLYPYILALGIIIAIAAMFLIFKGITTMVKSMFDGDKQGH
jgi:uncharacterized RDD family membrane protein YckC